MIGIGCDIEEVKRFAEVLDNREFLLNIFTEREISHCFAKTSPERYLALKFTAKEAVFKALSALNRKIPLKSIEILDDGYGRTRARIQTKKMRGCFKIHVNSSVTDEAAFASSIVYRR